MSKNITAPSNVIPFRKANLLLVDHSGQPFVPMKPVVDGMGLDWKTQYRKLQAGRFDSTMVMMTIVAEDGKLREMACLPLRKLAGWLMSIHASKVRPDLRENVIAYQNECDDALWAYWNDGIAIRSDDRSFSSVLSTTIGTDGFHCLAAVLDGKLRQLKGGAKRAAKNHVWQQVHRAFSVVRAEDIPADQLDSARCFIAAYDVREGEFIEAEKPAKKDRLDIHYPVGCLLDRRPGMLAKWNESHDRLTVSLTDLNHRHESPCEQIMHTLTNAGYDVDAAFWEIRTFRNKAEAFDRALDHLKSVFDGPQEFVIDKVQGSVA